MTRMRSEIAGVPGAAEALLARGAGAVAAAAGALRELDPPVIVTAARGSSDHAASYFKYLCELRLGRPVASVGPSVASIYGAPMRLAGAAFLGISQSGASPDIAAAARAARGGGALTVVLTNEPASPLAAEADITLALEAGAERSVAATKTFVNSAVAAAMLVAEWAQDDELRRALRALPEALDRAIAADWSPAREALAGAASAFCLGRGPALAMAGEAALKLKETCRLHAECYSAAEVLHGPVSLVREGFPVLALASCDRAEAQVAEVADDLAAKGGVVFAATDQVRRARVLPAIRTGHPLLDPIPLIASLYAMAERTAADRGLDPDAPEHLRKVTETT